MTDKTTIKQSNEITEGKYDYTTCQLDLLFMLLANIKDTDEPNKEYIIKIKDIEQITTRNYNLTQVKDSITDLGGKSFFLYTKDNPTQIWLFSQIKYYLNEAKIGILLNPQAKHLFYNLKDNFTVINLKSMLSLKSKYSKRIYALALQWKTTGKKEYTLKEFKEILGCKNKYKLISQLKENVLEPAHKEINELTDIEFEYELIKEGKSFEKIIIKLYQTKNLKNTKENQIDYKKDIEYQKRISEIKHIGINEDYAEILAKKINYIEFLNQKEKLINKIKNGQIIEDRAKYLVGTFQKMNILPTKKLSK